MRIKPILRGIRTYLPGWKCVPGTGGNVSARYCYSVWLRHATLARRNGLRELPKVVAEFGPGDSIGIGLAALVSGCGQYYGLDLVRHANAPRNAQIFDELVELFRSRAPIPGDDEWPNVAPKLERYDFPGDVFDEARLAVALDAGRLARIRASIADADASDSVVQYKVPWMDENVLAPGSVDLIYSQAVLEHVDDLDKAYRAMARWLKPGGFMSHVVDFKCHELADEWNGHWAYPDAVWKLIRGRRPFLLNREPHSTHLRLLRENGFQLACDVAMRSPNRLVRRWLPRRSRAFGDDDLSISGALIQAVKP
jgi:SAM-dependent methyltransferase